jgi:hypothetical protein
MSRFARCVSPPLAALAAVALSGCWYAGHSNGAEGNLDFGVVGMNNVAGRDLPFWLQVVRYPSQWQNICTQPAAATPALTPDEGVRPQGGNICPGNGQLDSTPLALTEAHCDDDACTVTDESNGSDIPPAGSLRLRVTAKQTGSIRVHVSARAQDGSGSWTDSYAVTVKAVDRIAWDHVVPDDAPAGGAVLVGTPADWTPEAWAADGTSLASVRDGFDTTWDGAAFAVGTDGIARAQQAGTATVTMQAAGLTKTATVRAFDPSEVVAMEVRAGTDIGAVGDGKRVDVATDVTQGDAVTSIELDNSLYEVGPYVVVLTLKDGTRALGGAKSLALTPVQLPGGLAVQHPASTYGWTFWLAPRGADPETVTLTGHIGAATLSLPMHVIDGFATGDAGAPDARE